MNLELESESIHQWDDVLQVKSKYLNKNTGLISQILKKLPELTVDERKEIGGSANQIKREIEDALRAYFLVPLEDSQTLAAKIHAELLEFYREKGVKWNFILEETK
jgi:phenylalanyl-tRNA synthetase alpha subunit